MIASEKAKPAVSRVVRLAEDQVAAIQRITEVAGAPPAQIIRWALEALEANVKANGGRLILPLTFEDPGEKSGGDEAGR